MLRGVQTLGKTPVQAKLGSANFLGAGIPRSRRRRNVYQVANASDGDHTLSVRNADVQEFVSYFTMAPGDGALPTNVAELNFAIKLSFVVCFNYFRALENLAENLAVLFPIKYHTLTG